MISRLLEAVARSSAWKFAHDRTTIARLSSRRSPGKDQPSSPVVVPSLCSRCSPPCRCSRSASATAADSVARTCARAPGGGLGLNNVAAHGRRAAGRRGERARGDLDGRAALARAADARGPRPARRRRAPADRSVAVGDVGTIFTSRDGGDCSVGSGVPNAALRGVAALPGVIVASRRPETLVWSTDGRAWTTADPGTANTLWGGTAAGGAAAQRSARDDRHQQRRTHVGAAHRPRESDRRRRRAAAVPVADRGARRRRGRGRGLRRDRAGARAAARSSRCAARPTRSCAASRQPARLRRRRLRRRPAALAATALSWRSAVSPTTVDLRGVVWTGSRFVAVGDQSTVVSSADGPALADRGDRDAVRAAVRDGRRRAGSSRSAAVAPCSPPPTGSRGAQRPRPTTRGPLRRGARGCRVRRRRRRTGRSSRSTDGRAWSRRPSPTSAGPPRRALDRERVPRGRRPRRAAALGRRAPLAARRRSEACHSVRSDRDQRHDDDRRRRRHDRHARSRAAAGSCSGDRPRQLPDGGGRGGGRVVVAGHNGEILRSDVRRADVDARRRTSATVNFDAVTWTGSRVRAQRRGRRA